MLTLKSFKAFNCLYADAKMYEGGLTDLQKEYMLAQTFLNPPPLVFSLTRLAITWKWYSGICKAKMLF